MSEQILRLPEVCKRVGLCRTTLYAKIKQHKFPSPIQIGKRAIGFKSSEVEGWIKSRSAVDWVLP